MSRVLDIVFVCQAGELEAKACLLAASIREFLPAETALHVIEPAPKELFGTVAEQTKSFLVNDMGARWYHFENPISQAYPIGNKLNAFRINPSGQRILFLDTDTCWVRTPETLDPLFKSQMAVKASEGQAYNDMVVYEQSWKKVYDSFGLAMPRDEYASEITGEWGPPYFNAGVISADADLNLSDEWIENCKKINEDSRITRKYPWLDQLGLAVTVEKLGIKTTILGNRYNFPLHCKQPSAYAKPFLVHYHSARNLSAVPVFSEAVSHIRRKYGISAFPAIAHPGETSPQSPARGPHQGASTPQTSRLFFITGMPRSGTSLLCSLLDRHANTAVLNEPKEIFACFRSSDPISIMNQLVTSWRSSISEGRPLPNKSENGQMVTNTFVESGKRFGEKGYEGIDDGEYRSAVRDNHFALGIKNTLVFQTCLPGMRKLWPGSVIVNLIRHPYYVIGSWIRTYEHLRDVILNRKDLLHGCHSPLLGREQRYQLVQIENVRDLAVKRAGFWCYLARRTPGHDDPLHVRLRYEDLVENPGESLEKILSLLHGPKASLPRLSHIDSRNVDANYELPAWQKEVIDRVCAPIMDDYGYMRY